MKKRMVWLAALAITITTGAEAQGFLNAMKKGALDAVKNNVESKVGLPGGYKTQQATANETTAQSAGDEKPIVPQGSDVIPKRRTATISGMVW